MLLFFFDIITIIFMKHQSIIQVIKLNKAYEGNPSWYYPVECTGLEDSLQQCKSNFSYAQNLQNCDDDYAIRVNCILHPTGTRQ